MYEVVLYTRKWRIPCDSWYFPGTDEGLRRAKEKRAELMARYLYNDVVLRNLR